VPLKTCTYDCVYCQLGRTTNRTTERREWVELERVVDEVKAKLATKPDYVTLSGSGEPTLYSRAGELIARIKEATEVPVAVLTNGSLLWMPEVRRALVEADVVVPSLDAPDAELFEQVNRAHPEITFEKMVRGLREFREEYRGQYWLEVVLLKGLTDGDDVVGALAGLTRSIGPDRVHLNTVTRPPAEESARAVSAERMKQLAAVFGDDAEVIADYHRTMEGEALKASCTEVLAMLARRPSTVEDIARGLSMHPNEVIKYVDELVLGGEIVATRQGTVTYYQPVR